MAALARRLCWLVVAVAAAGCDFQPDPPEGPSALAPTRLVNVRIEYRQPQGCENPDPARCVDLVWFFGSWMHAGEEIALEPVAGSYVWAGTATGVPVNWPPKDEPHLVRVFDPHLKDTPTGGVTAARLTIGGQDLTQYDQPGTPQESGRVYVDDNGVGRNPL
jgi:hypothetical protein